MCAGRRQIFGGVSGIESSVKAQVFRAAANWLGVRMASLDIWPGCLNPASCSGLPLHSEVEFWRKWKKKAIHNRAGTPLVAA